jgi:hypothetical protein
MSFNPLPAIKLDWDESLEPINTFLRYEVFRRNHGQDDLSWTKRVRINARGTITWTDYAVVSGQLYDYVVRVIRSDGGDEVSSDDPAFIQSFVPFTSTFIHAVGNEETYAELIAQSSQIKPIQPMTMVPLRGAPDPVVHIGSNLGRSFSLTLIGDWGNLQSNISRDVYAALEALQDAQAGGAPLCLRTGGGDFAYAVITDMPRQRTAASWGLTLALTRIKYPDTVA